MRESESQENYLETILIMSRNQDVVRSVDIATTTGYKKSSVSVAMKNLREKGYITVAESGAITFTKEGRALAELVYERHTILSTALKMLGVSDSVAAEDACRIEHDISDEAFAAVKNFISTHEKTK